MTPSVFVLPRRCNAAGIAIIQSFEGCRLKAYLCPAGVWTIGWGETGPGIGPGLVWTQAYADQRFSLSLIKRERIVSTLAPKQLTDNQYSACVSLVYNIGEGAFSTSTLLRRLRAGLMIEAADEFTRWNKAGGKVMAGLTRRRVAERELFLKPDP